MTDRVPVRVVLANDSELVIHGLRAMLEPFGDRVEVVAGALAIGHEDVHRALPGADVVLLDAFARAEGGLDAAAALLAEDPPYRVVLFTEARAEHLVRRALRLGVHGYVLKTVSAPALVEALEAVAAGAVVVSPEVAHASGTVGRSAWPGAARGLSRREAEVLVLLAEGRRPPEIAQELNIVLETVRSHLKRIYAKLGVSDRAGAVTIAWQDGLVGPADEGPERGLPVDVGSGSDR